MIVAKFTLLPSVYTLKFRQKGGLSFQVINVPFERHPIIQSWF